MNKNQSLYKYHHKLHQEDFHRQMISMDYIHVITNDEQYQYFLRPPTLYTTQTKVFSKNFLIECLYRNGMSFFVKSLWNFINFAMIGCVIRWNIVLECKEHLSSSNVSLIVVNEHCLNEDQNNLIEEIFLHLVVDYKIEVE